MLSIVTARVARQNEHYNYVATKGEKYLVRHEEGESASNIIVEHLSPYAISPVQIESVVVQKSTDLLAEPQEALPIYKATVQELLLNEKNGKTKRKTHKYYLQAQDFAGALDRVEDELCHLMGNFEIQSITKTPIIEILHSYVCES